MGFFDETTYTDEEALHGSMKDPELFGLIVSRYEEAFLRKARRIVRSPEDARDVVQDTFTKIYLKAHTFTPQEGASFSSWAYRILINTALTKYQKLKRENGRIQDIEPEFYEMLPDTTLNQFEQMEYTDMVLSFLARLPEHFSRILHMGYLEGLPHSAIAKKEGISIGAVKTRMHRAKQALKEVAKESTSLLV